MRGQAPSRPARAQQAQSGRLAGETGSALTNPEDTDFYNTFIPYLQNTGVGNDGAHNAIPHVFWWAWNANSGDTKGLVTGPDASGNGGWVDVRLTVADLCPALHSAELQPGSHGRRDQKLHSHVSCLTIVHRHAACKRIMLCVRSGPLLGALAEHAACRLHMPSSNAHSVSARPHARLRR